MGSWLGVARVFHDSEDCFALLKQGAVVCALEAYLSSTFVVPFEIRHCKTTPGPRQTQPRYGRIITKKYVPQKVGAYKAFHKRFRIAVTIHKVITYQITGDSTVKHFHVNNSCSINSTNYCVFLRGNHTQRFSSVVSDSMHVIIELHINVLLNVIYSIVCEMFLISRWCIVRNSIDVFELFIWILALSCRMMGLRNESQLSTQTMHGKQCMWLYYQDQVNK